MNPRSTALAFAAALSLSLGLTGASAAPDAADGERRPRRHRDLLGHVLPPPARPTHRHPGLAHHLPLHHRQGRPQHRLRDGHRAQGRPNGPASAHHLRRRNGRARGLLRPLGRLPQGHHRRGQPHPAADGPRLGRRGHRLRRSGHPRRAHLHRGPRRGPSRPGRRPRRAATAGSGRGRPDRGLPGRHHGLLPRRPGHQLGGRTARVLRARTERQRHRDRRRPRRSAEGRRSQRRQHRSRSGPDGRLGPERRLSPS